MAYLIEDDNLKSKQILPFLADFSPDLTVEHYRSYQSGLKAIGLRHPNLVVLDMSLPTFDMTGVGRHGRPRSLGGYELMRKMKRTGAGCPVFIISALETFGDGKDTISFHEVKARCQSEFPDIYLGAVFFSQSSDAWKNSLREVLRRVLDGNNGGGN